MRDFALFIIGAATLVQVIWLVWVTKMALDSHRDCKSIITADRVARSSRINSVTSKELSGPIARDQQGKPIRVAKERQLLKFEMRGGEYDSDPSSSRL